MRRCKMNRQTAGLPVRINDYALYIRITKIYRGFAALVQWGIQLSISNSHFIP
jgi:hypothetical protein